MKPKDSILLLGKSVKLDYEYMKDDTHSGLVNKLQKVGFKVNLIDRDRRTLDYLANPSSVKEYDLAIYDTISNLYSFDDEGSKRSIRFRDVVANQLKAMNIPILVLADLHVTKMVRETAENYGFITINQPYNNDAVVSTIKSMLE